MHARYVLVWFLAGLAALVLSALAALVLPNAHPMLLALAIGQLALGISLGLLPAFARRDWPSPVYAFAAASLSALAVAFVWEPRAFAALSGASLVAGALQPLALLVSPRWKGARVPDPFRITDAIAFAGILLALVLLAAAGALLIALPRGLPNAAFALLIPGALAAALSALLFLVPREERAPMPLATLSAAALALFALGGSGLAFAFARPVGAEFRLPAFLLAIAPVLATIAFARARSARGLLAGPLALAWLAPIALVLATLGGAPNALLPAAFHAGAALALVSLAAAYALGAPILLPGRPKGGRAAAWAAALFVAALFLYTPALQYGRAVAPAALAGLAGVLALVWALRPLASSAPPRSRRR